MDGQAKVSLILELKERLKTGLSKAKENLNGAVRDMKGKLASLKTTHIQAFNAMSDQLPGFGNALSLLANPYALITAGVLALGAAGVKSAQWSNQWAKNLAEVNVTAQLTPKALDKLSDKLVDIGARNVAPLEEIPNAFNRIISAGLDVNTSLKVLEPTLRAAKAGFTDMETVAAAGVGVMASSGENINRVYDILFATLNKGNAKFKDIAQYLPKIVPLARGAGFALDETAAAWAYLTAQGQSAEQATTGVMNMIKALGSGSSIRGLKSVGIDIYTDKGKIKPIVEIVDLLSTKMKGLTDKQKTKFLEKAGIVDQEAKGALLSMIQNVDKLKSTTDAVVKSQGALNKAYNDAKTPMDNWMIIMNQLKGRVVKPLGDLLLGAFAKLGFWLLKEGTNIVNWFKTLSRESTLFIDLVAVLGKTLEFTFKASLAPARFLWWVFSSFVEALGRFANSDWGKGIETMYMRIRPYLIWMKDVILQIVDIGAQAVQGNFSEAWKKAKALKTPDIDKIREKQWAEWVERKKKKDDSPFTDENTDNVFDPTKPDPADKGLNDDIDKLTGKAAQVRNITINIDSFVKGGINTENTILKKMDEKQIEAYLREMFSRLMANVETSYQGG